MTVQYYSLTHPQKRIWYNEKIYPGTSVHNIGGPIRIKGPINFKLLQKAINLFIKHNIGVRLQLHENNGECTQYIGEFTEKKFDFCDFSSCEKQEDHFASWARNKIQAPIPLLDSPLYYFAIFKINENDNGYFVMFHHIIADGWSINIMTEQICNHYLKLKAEPDPIEENFSCSYLEYMELEQKYLSSDRFVKDQSFWSEQFLVLPEALLVKDREQTTGRRRTYHLESGPSRQMKDFVAQNKISLNTFFTALLALYFYHFSHQTDLVFGIPVLNRSGKKEKSIFGMFTSTMPFRIAMNTEESVLEFIDRINQELMNCYFHQKYPYNFLVQDLELKKRGYHSLFQVCVNYYNTKLNTQLDGYPIENVEFYNGSQLYSLQLVIKDWSDAESLTLDFDYKINTFTEAQIEKMFALLMNIAQQVLEQPQQKLTQLTLVTEKEKQQLLYELNQTAADYPKGKSIVDLFEEQVLRTPEKIALYFEGTVLTYQELNRKANQLAGFLKKKGVTADTIVAILTTHSPETVIGIMATLKAGGAYLPIDPKVPVDRLRYLLHDSSAPILLTNFSLDSDLRFTGEIIPLTNPEIYSGADQNPDDVRRTTNLAYVIYTSGSTGKPKGVMIEQQGLVNYIWWAKKVYVRHENEVFALYSSLAFDLTATSVFTPLISGNKIMIYHDDGNEFILYRVLRENQASIIKLTPSHLSLLKEMDNRQSSVKRFIVGGEDLKVDLAAKIWQSFGGAIEIYNEYGPTETVVGCMIHKYEVETDTAISVPIGVPADNVQIYILTDNLDPVPAGSPGEIFIAGDGVARGYLNQPELTAARFVNNPFVPGKRMYKTGDLARFNENYKIEYLGRMDNQVKIRGFRIELGEIEKHLLAQELVEDAVVIDREDDRGAKYLCAYIVTRAEFPTAKIRDYLSAFLPDSMIPQYFVYLKELPLTPNGKVNRVLLPAPQPRGENLAVDSIEWSTSQRRWVDLIQEILNVERIKPNDNFYYLGGDSIKAIQIAAKLNEIGLKVKVKEILAHPVMAELAAQIEVSNEMDIPVQPCEGELEPTPIVTWFFAQQFRQPEYWNQSVFLKLKQQLDLKKIETALRKLVERHDALRLNWNPRTKKLFYNPQHFQATKIMKLLQLGLDPPVEQDRKMAAYSEVIKSSFNLETGLLFRACLFDLGQRGQRLLLTAHHLLVDGVSWRIILSDLNSLLTQMSSGIEPYLTPEKCSLKQWANQLQNLAQAERVLQEQPGWEGVILSYSPFAFPTDRQTGLNHSKSLIQVLTSEETDYLLTGSSQVYNTEPRELLIIALALAIHETKNLTDVVIELEGHGREDLAGEYDLSRTVGWFTTLFPVRLQIRDTGLDQTIKSLKEQLRQVPNKGFYYGILQYLAKVLPNHHQRYIRFNYLGDFGNSFQNSFFEFADEDHGADSGCDNHLTTLIDIVALVVKGNLNISITYNENLFFEATINDLATAFLEQLRRVLTHCLQKGRVEFTPSDFNTTKMSQQELDELFN